MVTNSLGALHAHQPLKGRLLTNSATRTQFPKPNPFTPDTLVSGPSARQSPAQNDQEDHNHENAIVRLTVSRVAQSTLRQLAEETSTLDTIHKTAAYQTLQNNTHGHLDFIKQHTHTRLLLLTKNSAVWGTFRPPFLGLPPRAETHKQQALLSTANTDP